VVTTGAIGAYRKEKVIGSNSELTYSFSIIQESVHLFTPPSIIPNFELLFCRTQL